MKMTRKWMLVFLGVAWALLLGVTLPEPASGQTSGGGASMFQSYTKPLPLPDFSLEDLSGKMVQIKDCRGKVILLHFWATW
jgi:cytochrome oxidase Cu insertion factor (SCO1/SenC/PrrC family)